MDFDTYGPRVRHPTTSNITPSKTACARVRARAPTAVPTELQMSFEALPHAVIPPPMRPSTKATLMFVAFVAKRTTTTTIATTVPPRPRPRPQPRPRLQHQPSPHP